MSVSAIVANQREAYRQGFADGLATYSWMKDGVTYVGTCGTTLREAKTRLERHWNYYPGKVEDL